MVLGAGRGEGSGGGGGWGFRGGGLEGGGSDQTQAVTIVRIQSQRPLYSHIAAIALPDNPIKICCTKWLRIHQYYYSAASVPSQCYCCKSYYRVERVVRNDARWESLNPDANRRN